MDEHAFPPTGFAVARLGRSLHIAYSQVELKRENEYIVIPIFKYILSFKDSSS